MTAAHIGQITTEGEDAGYVRICGSMTRVSIEGAVMWVFGYVDRFSEECALDVSMGESDTFPAAVSELWDYVRNELDSAEEYEVSNWEVLKKDIYELRHNLAEVDNPEESDDVSLYDSYGTEFYIQRV